MEFDHLEGETFGEFSVGRILGRGPEGVTYEALRKDARFALKVFSPALFDDYGERVSDYLDHLKNAARIHHTHLARIDSLGEVEGLRYAAVEFVDGPSLAEILGERGTLSLPETTEVLRQMLKALSAAHKAGIVHGDIRPEKIRVDPDGRWKILGLGFPAHLLAEDETAFPPPAGAAPQPDLRGLGAVAYEMLTGRPPYSGASGEASPEAPPDADTLNPSIPHLLSDYLNALLAEEASRTFPGAPTASKALESALIGVPFSLDAPPPAPDLETDEENETQEEREETVLGDGQRWSSLFEDTDDAGEPPQAETGEEETEDEGPRRPIVSISEHFQEETVSEDAEGEAVVDVGPWAKEKDAGEEATEEEETRTAEVGGGFGEFLQMREDVAKEVESQITRKETPEEEVGAILARARDAWGKKAAEAAAQDLMKALTLDPENAEALRLKGEIDAFFSEIETGRAGAETAFERGRLKQARMEYEEILRRNPGNLDARKRLGQIDEAIGKRQERLKWIVTASAAGVLLVVVAVLGAILATRDGTGNGKAGRPGAPSPRPAPTPSPAPKKPGDGAGGAGQASPAPGEDEKALEARFSTALETLEGGDWKAAAAAFRALEESPSFAERATEKRKAIEAAREAEAEALETSGEIEKAAALFEEMEEVFPDRGWARRGRELRYERLLEKGKAFLDLGMAEKAMALLAEAEALDVDGRAKALLDEAGMGAWRARAAKCEKMGYWEGAKFYYEKMLGVRKDDEDLKARVQRLADRIEYEKRVSRTDALFLEGDVAGALKEARRAQAMDSAEAWVDRAVSFLETVSGMIRIPGGTVSVGDPRGSEREKPVWETDLKTFFIIRTR